nr:hypothetical protein TEA_019292 [Ipomoea trifida]
MIPNMEMIISLLLPYLSTSNILIIVPTALRPEVTRDNARAVVFEAKSNQLQNGGSAIHSAPTKLCATWTNKVGEARTILEKIYPAINEVEEEMSGLKSSLEEEKCEIGDGLISEVKNAWRNGVVRRGLYAGITVQVAHNLVGIRMYYVPTILQLVGFASNTTALALSLVTSGLNAVGTIISMLLLALQGHSSYSQAVHSLDLCGHLLPRT